jgi:hypothetical protein
MATTTLDLLKKKMALVLLLAPACAVGVTTSKTTGATLNITTAPTTFLDPTATPLPTTAATTTGQGELCLKIQCSALCEDGCGWDAKTSSCTAEAVTSAAEVEAKLGDCSMFGGGGGGSNSNGKSALSYVSFTPILPLIQTRNKTAIREPHFFTIGIVCKELQADLLCTQ